MISGKLAGNERADVVVVGAGIAGISCAYHLEKAGFDAIVLEENQVASGATQYSSGVLYFGTGTDFQTAIKLFGKEKAKLLWNETKQSIDELVALADGVPDKAGLHSPGLMLVARNEEEKNYLEQEALAMSELGFPGELLDASQVKQVFSATDFAGGLNQPVGHQIKPPKLVRSLAEKLETKIFENSGMTEIAGAQKDGVVVRTAEGSVSAKQVVVATNLKPFYGLEQHFSFEDSADLPSVELPAEKVSELWPVDKIISTSDERYDLFYRHDNKFFFEAYQFKAIEEKARQYFPAEVVFEKAKAYGDSWAKTGDWLPILGEASDKVHACIAMGDQGIVVGWTCGRHAPAMLKGESNWFLEACSPKRFSAVPQ